MVTRSIKLLVIDFAAWILDDSGPTTLVVETNAACDGPIHPSDLTFSFSGQYSQECMQTLLQKEKVLYETKTKSNKIVYWP